MAWPRILWITGTVLLVTMVVHIAALMATGGPWTGPVSLRKPATFAETGWLACWSVALILPVVGTRAWQAQGIETDVPGPIKALIDRRVADGHGAHGLTSLIHRRRDGYLWS